MILITCEHGGNDVPSEFQHVFRDAKRALDSHRGLDLGALELAKRLSKRLDSSLIYSTTSRLLVDLNRTLGARGSYSEFSRRLSTRDRERVAELYFHPYRREIESHLARTRGQKIHASIHSFTPILEGKRRRCDMGILFDPSRKSEREIASRLRNSLSRHLPDWKIFFNSPYRGTGDGLTTDMRKRFGATYAGIEIEVRQDHLVTMIKNKKLAEFASLLATCLRESVTGASTRT